MPEGKFLGQEVELYLFLTAIASKIISVDMLRICSNDLEKNMKRKFSGKHGEGILEYLKIYEEVSQGYTVSKTQVLQLLQNFLTMNQEDFIVKR